MPTAFHDQYRLDQLEAWDRAEEKGRCSVCGHEADKLLKGVCAECRKLEGSVWKRGWDN